MKERRKRNKSKTPINNRAYQELLYLHYQITTDNFEQNESPLAPENLIRVTHIINDCYFGDIKGDMRLESSEVVQNFIFCYLNIYNSEYSHYNVICLTDTCYSDGRVNSKISFFYTTVVYLYPNQTHSYF